MASIRKRTWKTGGVTKTAWIVDHFDQGGQRHIKTFSTKKEAAAWRDEAGTQIRRGTYAADSTSLTIGEAGDLWLADARDGGPDHDPLERSTVEQYRAHLDLHIKPFIGDRKISAFNAPDVREYQRQLRKAGRSPVLVRRVTVSLGAILGHAMAEGKAARNVVSEISRTARRKRGDKQDKRQKRKIQAGVDFPDKAELSAMLAKVQGRWRPIILTAMFAGLRSSELRGLTWADVDFQRRTVTVSQRADQWGDIGEPKSEAGRRTIPLGPMVLNTLREWKLACPKSEAGLVFPNGKGKPESHSNIINRGLIPLVESIGAVTEKRGDDGKVVKGEDGKPAMVAKYTGLHQLRHVAASLWIAQAFTPARVKDLMGHSTIQMTFDTYGHLWPTPEEDHRIMAKIEAELVG